MYEQISRQLYETFCTDQTSYIKQQNDGIYLRTFGALSPQIIEKSLQSKESIGSYQRNLDSTVNWICFDFDVAKIHLGQESFNTAIVELNQAVNEFCKNLRDLSVPYLLEFSGNRGMHIWILFSEKISYRTANAISHAILSATQINFNQSLVNLDLFPATKVPSSGVGSGVKIPLSKHKKSLMYSLLLADGAKAEDSVKLNELTNEIILQQNSILANKKNISLNSIKDRLGNHFVEDDEIVQPPLRIKTINIHKDGFTFNELKNHWNKTSPLSKLINRITDEKQLNHNERKLIVGIFSHVICHPKKNFSRDVQHLIFSKLENYKSDLTDWTSPTFVDVF